MNTNFKIVVIELAAGQMLDIPC